MLRTLLALLSCLIIVTGCSSTIYGIPKSEWNKLTPRQKQQLSASANIQGKGEKPSIMKVFEKNPPATPEAGKQDDIASGNN